MSNQQVYHQLIRRSTRIYRPLSIHKTNLIQSTLYKRNNISKWVPKHVSARTFHSETISLTEVSNVNMPGRERRYFINGEGQTVSPWHDLPCYVATSRSLQPEKTTAPHLLHIVSTTPRNSHAILDIAYYEPNNPFYHTVDALGAARFYVAAPTFSRGFVPQTFSDPTVEDTNTHIQGIQGCNTALQVIDLSEKKPAPGAVYTAQVLGAIGVMDPTRKCAMWQLLVARPNDPVIQQCLPTLATETQEATSSNELTDETNDIPDIKHASTLLRRRIQDIQHWFVTHKLHENGSELPLLADGAILDASEALKLVQSHNEMWYSFAIQDRIASFETTRYGYENLSLAYAKPWRPDVDWQPYESHLLKEEHRYAARKVRDPETYYTTSKIKQDANDTHALTTPDDMSTNSQDGVNTRRHIEEIADLSFEKDVPIEQIQGQEAADMHVMRALMHEASQSVHRSAMIQLAGFITEKGTLPTSSVILKSFQHALSGAGGPVEELDSSFLRADVAEPSAGLISRPHGHDGLRSEHPRTTMEVDGALAEGQLHEALRNEIRNGNLNSPRVRAVAELLLAAKTGSTPT